MDKVFIDNLKAARIAANKTQKDVADAIGVAKSTYSQYETGKREPGIIGIKKIAKYLESPLLGTKKRPPEEVFRGPEGKEKNYGQQLALLQTSEHDFPVIVL